MNEELYHQVDPFESELYLDDRRFYDTKERFENNSTATQDRSWN